MRIYQDKEHLRILIDDMSALQVCCLSDLIELDEYRPESKLWFEDSLVLHMPNRERFVTMMATLERFEGIKEVAA